MKIQMELVLNGYHQMVERELTGIEINRTFLEELHRRDNNFLCTLLKDEYDRWDEVPEDLMDTMIGEFRGLWDTVKNRPNGGKQSVAASVFKKHQQELEPYKTAYKLFSKEVSVVVKQAYTIRAKTEEEADEMFERWWQSDCHVQTAIEDMSANMGTYGDWDYNNSEEIEGDPDTADITEEKPEV